VNNNIYIIFVIIIIFFIFFFFKKKHYLLIILNNSIKNTIFAEFGFVSCFKFAIPTNNDSEALNIHNKNDNKIVLEFMYLLINLLIFILIIIILY